MRWLRLINQTLGSGCVTLHQAGRSIKSNSGVDALKALTGEMIGGAGFDAGDSGRQSGLHGSGRSAIRRGAVEGREFDSSGRWKTTRPRRRRSGIFRKRTILETLGRCGDLRRVWRRFSSR